MASDLWIPTVAPFGYLRELETMLNLLSEHEAKAYVFFRQCTRPTSRILELIDQAGHEVGLHLENSRTFDTFQEEKCLLEHHVRRPVTAFSKHGSGGAKYGLHHFAPYEPDRYVDWGDRCGMRLFLGNLEDPRLAPSVTPSGLQIYPGAFWLEPAWRDTEAFTVSWLIEEAAERDIVLLMHPENVLADRELVDDLRRILVRLPTGMMA